MRGSKIERLREHVAAVCTENEIIWREVPEDVDVDGLMMLADDLPVEALNYLAKRKLYDCAYSLDDWPVKVIVTRPLASLGDYFVALHELGHVLGRNQGKGCSRWQKELGAWEWALASTLVQPTKEVWALIAQSCRSHMKKYDFGDPASFKVYRSFAARAQRRSR